MRAIYQVEYAVVALKSDKALIITLKTKHQIYKECEYV